MAAGEADDQDERNTLRCSTYKFAGTKFIAGTRTWGAPLCLLPVCLKAKTAVVTRSGMACSDVLLPAQRTGGRP